MSDMAGEAVDGSGRKQRELLRYKAGRLARAEISSGNFGGMTRSQRSHR